jgi:hypothetical protein
MGKEPNFLDMHKEHLESIGFYEEINTSYLCQVLEGTYITSIIKDYYISKIVPDKDVYLVKWKKRFRQLTDSEIKDKYGRE